MKVRERPALKALNFFSVRATAALLISLEDEEDLLSAPSFDASRDIILGEGSNVLFASDVPGTVYLNRIRGIDLIHRDERSALVEVGAGENWHDLVCWSLNEGYCGLENLSLIPGTVGAAPVQNIGAYGVELSSVLDSLTAWDLRAARWVTFSRASCELAYRDSLFKTGQPDRYLITSVRLRLNRFFEPRLDYAGLKEELAGKADLTAADVSAAVIRLRRRKLPDPSVTANAGSFFKNPVLQKSAGKELLARFPELPNWPAGRERTKVSAAWMIEHCGFRGFRKGDAAISSQHALVLVNHGNAGGRELLQLADRVREAVAERFDVRLEPEPRIIQFN